MTRVAIAAGALALCACFLPPHSPLPRPEKGAWAEARDRYTRHGEIYDRLEDKAFVTATYDAPSLREERVNRLAAWLALPGPEREARLAAERADGEKFEDFLLSVFTSDRGDNDLDSPRSIWRVRLVGPGGEEVAPVRIEEVPPDATLTLLYTYIGHFDLVYRVRFPRAPGAAPLGEAPFLLRLASARGKLELDFGPGPKK